MKYSAHIDVAHGEKLEIVYFILLPFARYLPKEKKIVFHETVDRSTV
jgi:inositol 1,4,5-triphosphate receptor type 1/inositol 1,4,5-triphosphate receptor type 3